MKIFILVLSFVLAGCTRNVSEVKRFAPNCARQLGYEIIGYEGYQLSLIMGGFVWYTLRRVPDNGIIYHGAFTEWNDECHVYNLSAIDAIKP